MVNQNKFNLNNLQFKSNKNQIDLNTKIQIQKNLKNTNEYFSTPKLVYYSDWVLCELEKIKSATSLNEGDLLPEKANYSFSINLNIPEAYLPFLKFDVLAKTLPEQQIIGTGEFNYSSLREVAFQTYNWKGFTQIIYFPPPPEHLPQPSLLYIDRPFGEFGAREYTFKYATEHFPVPQGQGEYILPGGLEDYSDEFYLTQYWETSATWNFNELVAYFGYSEAVDILNESYPNIITTEDEGDYHAYEIVYNPAVETCNQQTIINKLGEDNFQININGYFLLLSPAITLTEWSDPLAPTYEPGGEDLFASLRVYFKQPLQTININNYDKI